MNAGSEVWRHIQGTGRLQAEQGCSNSLGMEEPEPTETPSPQWRQGSSSEGSKVKKSVGL